MKIVTIIGMGLTPKDLTAEHLKVIEEADILVGGKRLLAHFAQCRAQKKTIDKNIKDIVYFVKTRMASQSVVFLASGDPLFFGIGARLVKARGAENVVIYPNISSVAAAFARIKEPWSNVRVVIGPGNLNHLTQRAIDVLTSIDVVAGYTTYIDLIHPFIDGKEIIRTGMTKEVARVEAAIEQARAGKSCAIVSSGDPGIYAMAGLVFETCQIKGLTIVHPGSDPNAAARADFVIVLSNPKSKKRNWQLEQAREILLRPRDKNTPVGIVSRAMREQQPIEIVTLENMHTAEVDMQTTMFIGSSTSSEYMDFMVTPRGYTQKYEIQS